MDNAQLNSSHICRRLANILLWNSFGSRARRDKLIFVEEKAPRSHVLSILHKFQVERRWMKRMHFISSLGFSSYRNRHCWFQKTLCLNYVAETVQELSIIFERLWYAEMCNGFICFRRKRDQNFEQISCTFSFILHISSCSNIFATKCL